MCASFVVLLLSCFDLCGLVLSCVAFRFVLCCVVLSCLVFCCVVLSLSSLVLSWLVFSFLVLSCLLLSCLVSRAHFCLGSFVIYLFLSSDVCKKQSSFAREPCAIGVRREPEKRTDADIRAIVKVEWLGLGLGFLGLWLLGLLGLGLGFEEGS